MGRVKRRRSKKSLSLALVLETTLEVLLIFILGFTPLAFGTVHPWSKFIFVSACLALGVVGAILCFLPPSPEGEGDKPTPRLTLELCIGLLFMGLLMLQTIPLPKAFVGAISPGTVTHLEQWLAPGPVPDWITLSLYPNATRLDLAIITSLCILFWVLTTHFSSSEKIRRVILVAAFIGGILGFIALAHQMLGLRKIFGIVTVITNATNGGVFVNTNNFGQFALLTLGLTAGAAVYQQRRVKGLERSLKKQPSDDTIQKLKDQRILRLILVVGGLILICAIAGSTSRASFVGLVLGALLCGMFLVRRVTNPVTLGVWSLGLIVVIFILSLTSIETVFDQIKDVDSAFDSFSHRTRVAGDLIREWQSVPIFGVGEGTHAVVYPAFQSFQSDRFIEYGDMDYFQFLAENGLVGVVLLLAFFVTVFWRTIKTVTAHKHRLQVVAIGLSGGLLGVAVVSMTDFGQRFPGVSVFTVLSIAMIVNLYRLRDEEEEDEKKAQVQEVVEAPGRPLRVPHVAIAAFLLVISLFGVWAFFCNWQASRSMRAYQAADRALRAVPFPASVEHYKRRLDHAQAANLWEPGNVVHAANYANALWLTLCDINTIEDGILTREPQLTKIAQIYDRANTSRRLGPSYARLPSIMGYMDAVRGNKDQAIMLADLSVRLSHSEASILFDAGAVYLMFGLEKRATDTFANALLCSSGTWFPDVRRLLIDKSSRPDLLVASIPDSMVVSTLAYQNLTESGSSYPAIVAPLRRLCIATLEATIKEYPRRMTPGRYFLLAQLYSDQDQPEKALAILENAVGIRSTTAQRLKLLQYVRLGRYDDALVLAQRIETDKNNPLTDAIRSLMAQQAASQPSATKPAASQPAKP